MEDKKEVKILYSCVIDKLRDRCDYDGNIARDKVLFILGTIFHIPKELRNILIEELLDLKLIKLSDRTGNKMYYRIIKAA